MSILVDIVVLIHVAFVIDPDSVTDLKGRNIVVDDTSVNMRITAAILECPGFPRYSGEPCRLWADGHDARQRAPRSRQA